MSLPSDDPHHKVVSLLCFGCYRGACVLLASLLCPEGKAKKRKGKERKDHEGSITVASPLCREGKARKRKGKERKYHEGNIKGTE